VNYKVFKMADLDLLSHTYSLRMIVYSLLAVIEKVLMHYIVPWKLSVRGRGRKSIETGRLAALVPDVQMLSKMQSCKN
jgi:hypothetical protein